MRAQNKSWKAFQCVAISYSSSGFFPSKQMYLFLLLVERKEAEFYHNIDRRRYLVWLRWLIFIAFPLLYYQKENNFFCNNVLLKTCKCVTFWIERVQTIVVLNSEDTKKVTAETDLSSSLCWKSWILAKHLFNHPRHLNEHLVHWALFVDTEALHINWYDVVS